MHDSAPTTTAVLSPKTGTPRPTLPRFAANPMIMSLDTSKPPPVKFQVIVREGQEIIVGRVKIPTPSGHAFVLRRFDTGAVSLTTMFRAAFPDVGEDFEKSESAWVKANYETAGANGSSATGKALRLAGTWVPVQLSQHIAPDYGLTSIMSPLANSVPDTSVSYRKSMNRSPREEVRSPSSTLQPPVSPSAPNKRRKESPALATAALNVPRSTRSKSKSPGPPAANGMITSPTPAKTPKKSLAAAILSPGGNDHADSDHEEAPEVAGPDMHEDIAQQKELIARLKEERAAAQGDAEALNPRKRALAGTPPLTLDLNKQSPQDIAERPIVKKTFLLTANQKSAAWGTLAFALGLGATTFLPQFF